MKISIDNKYYEVKHQFSDNRCLIDFDGLFVFADRYEHGWELSGVPAREDEVDILNNLLKPTLNKTFVKVIPPEEQ